VLALAQRAALAIDNARLYEQAQQVATLEERQRLARELHDAVTQTLFSSTLIADVLPALYERDAEEGQRHLQQLRRLTRGALAEMRSLLVELRPGALNDLPLPDLLKQLADGVQGRTMLEVTVHVSGQPFARLPDPVHVAVYRVAQEALTNVVKHAGAQHATLDVQYRPDGLVLRVEDDGRGFDPRQRAPGHLGLGIMRERAQGIGATLQVRSRPGAGTQLTLTWRAGLPAAAR
jgi:signal transduction histidine kinase